MAKGGKRPGAGRKAKPKLPFAAKAQAASVLNKLGGHHGDKKLPSEDDLWLSLVLGQDLRVRMDALKYLTDRRDGKAVQNINHLHDKPIEVNHTFSIADKLREARERATKR